MIEYLRKSYTSVIFYKIIFAYSIFTWSPELRDLNLRTIMLYSLCMKFQDQLENCVLCKTFSSRQNSEVHPSVTTHEELKNIFE